METASRVVASAAKRKALAELGKRLQAARENTGLTQRAVADRLGLSAQTIRNWEAGRHEPAQGDIENLASLYCVQSQQLREGSLPPGIKVRQRDTEQRVRVNPELLVQAREDAGLPQAKAAEQAGINTSSLRRYEHGKARPTKATLRRLALAYGKPPYWPDPEPPIENSAAEPSHMDDALRAYLKVQPDLDEESVSLIAGFILFAHQRLMRRNRE